MLGSLLLLDGLAWTVAYERDSQWGEGFDGYERHEPSSTIVFNERLAQEGAESDDRPVLIASATPPPVARLDEAPIAQPEAVSITAMGASAPLLNTLATNRALPHSSPAPPTRTPVVPEHNANTALAVATDEQQSPSLQFATAFAGFEPVDLPIETSSAASSSETPAENETPLASSSSSPVERSGELPAISAPTIDSPSDAAGTAILVGAPASSSNEAAALTAPESLAPSVFPDPFPNLKSATAAQPLPLRSSDESPVIGSNTAPVSDNKGSKEFDQSSTIKPVKRKDELPKHVALRPFEPTRAFAGKEIERATDIATSPRARPLSDVSLSGSNINSTSYHNALTGTGNVSTLDDANYKNITQLALKSDTSVDLESIALSEVALVALTNTSRFSNLGEPQSAALSFATLFNTLTRSLILPELQHMVSIGS